MASRTKAIMPGVEVRKAKSGRKTLRFYCMINGNRFTRTCDLPFELMVDQQTGRATAELRAEYNIWVDECSKRVGKVLRFGLKVPTIEELITTYERMATQRSQDPNYRKPKLRTIETAVIYYNYCVDASGLARDRSVSELMDTDMVRRIFDKLCKRISGISAWSYVMSLKTVTATWTIPRYKDLGYIVAQPVLPDVGNVKRAPEYKTLSSEMKSKIEAWYTALAQDPDRRLYLAASMVYNLAVRPNDVARLTAENFVNDEDDGHVHLVYRPHKTVDSSNRRVDWPIHPALVDLIRDVAGDRLKEGRPLISNAYSIFRRLNKSMRAACGIEDWTKAVYELRKLCVDTVRREQGVDAAVALSGDRRETIDRYYSDPYKLKDARVFTFMKSPDDAKA